MLRKTVGLADRRLRLASHICFQRSSCGASAMFDPRPLRFDTTHSSKVQVVSRARCHTFCGQSVGYVLRELSLDLFEREKTNCGNLMDLRQRQQPRWHLYEAECELSIGKADLYQQPHRANGSICETTGPRNTIAITITAQQRYGHDLINIQQREVPYELVYTLRTEPCFSEWTSLCENIRPVVRDI